jgi:hypothetical protein
MDVVAFATLAVYVVVPLANAGLSVPPLSVSALSVLVVLGVVNEYHSENVVPTLDVA